MSSGVRSAVLVIVLSVSLASTVEPRQCPLRGRLRSVDGTLALATGRRFDLAACADTCIAAVAMCRRTGECRDPRYQPRCGSVRRVEVRAPQTGARRRVVRMRDKDGATTQAVVTCRRASRDACAALALPEDAVYDLYGFSETSTAVARLWRAATGEFELTLRPRLLDEFILRGFADLEGTLRLQGDGALGGDALVAAEARIPVTAGNHRLEGSVTYAASVRALSIELELDGSAAGRDVPSPLPLVLDLSKPLEDSPATSLVDLPISLAPTGVATIGPGSVTVGEATLARVGVGDCLISPTRRLSCVLPWEEVGPSSAHVWLAGTLGERVEFGQNQVLVGAPPLIEWVGMWRLRDPAR